jgi:branched-chain amino acid transport system permease protein
MAEASHSLKSLLRWTAFGLIMSAAPLVVKNPYYINVANIIGLNAIIVVGLNLLIGYAGQISLGHAAFFGLGAYISAILSVAYGISPWLSLVIAVIATALVALIIGIPTLKLKGHYLVMATLGFNLIVNIVMVQWDGLTGGPSGFPGVPSLSLGKWSFDTDIRMYYLIWGMVFLAVAVAINLVNSRAGRGLRALHGSEIAADSLGVNTKSYKIKVFVLSAVYAALAGALYAHYLTFVSPKTFDIFFSVELVTMVIVGGMGSIVGALCGTAFLTALPNGLHLFEEYKDIFYGLILVLILIFMPEGIFVGIRGKLRPAKKSAVTDDRQTAPETENVCPILFPENCKGQADDPAPLLRVNDVSMSFGGIMALADVSFDLPEGCVTALIGPNGAGKTTMINVISGIYAPKRGSVIFGGDETTGCPPHRMADLGLTRTFQNNQIFAEMSVKENVMTGMHARAKSDFLRSVFRLPGFRKEERLIERRCLEILEFFNLLDMADEPAGTLPYGLQKRVEIAKALVQHPKLMLLDEPVAGLNITESLEMAKLILKIREAGITILLVEHDMNVVMGVSDHIIVLNYGRKIAEGRPKDIQRNEEVITAYLGSVA